MAPVETSFGRMLLEIGDIHDMSLSIVKDKIFLDVNILASMI